MKEEVSKKGGSGGQKMIFLKKYFQNRNTQKFEFFKKEGLRGSKNENFEKYLQNQKGLQKLGTKHVPHPPKGENFF